MHQQPDNLFVQEIGTVMCRMSSSARVAVAGKRQIRVMFAASRSVPTAVHEDRITLGDMFTGLV